MDFRKIAQKATTLAEIMQGRDKGETRVLINAGLPVTIDNFEPFTMYNERTKKDEEVYAYTVEEYPQLFFFAGYVLKKIFKSWVDVYNNYEECIANFKECGGVKVRLKAGRTKDSGNDVTIVEVL